MPNEAPPTWDETESVPRWEDSTEFKADVPRWEDSTPSPVLRSLSQQAEALSVDTARQRYAGQGTSMSTANPSTPDLSSSPNPGPIPAAAFPQGDATQIQERANTPEELAKTQALSTPMVKFPRLTERDASNLFGEGTTGKIVQGIQNATADLAEGLTTPETLAIGAWTAVPGPVGVAIKGLVAADMAKGSLSMLRQIYDASERGDTAEVARLSASYGANTLMALGLGKHTAESAKFGMPVMEPGQAAWTAGRMLEKGVSGVDISKSPLPDMVPVLKKAEDSGLTQSAEALRQVAGDKVPLVEVPGETAPGTISEVKPETPPEPTPVDPEPTVVKTKTPRPKTEAQQFDDLVAEHGEQLGWGTNLESWDQTKSNAQGNQSGQSVKGMKVAWEMRRSAASKAIFDIGGDGSNVSAKLKAEMLPKLKAYLQSLSEADTQEHTVDTNTDFLPPEETAPIPKLRPGEKQGDVFANQTEDFALVGEKGKDLTKAAESKAKVERDDAEDKAIQDKQQKDLFAPQLSRGPGAAAGGEPGSYDPASQLTDSLKTIKEPDPLKRGILSERMADMLSEGKSFVERSWAKVVATKESIKHTLMDSPEVTPIKRLVAALDWQIQKSSALSRELGRSFEKSIPDQTRRDALAVFIDAGQDAARVQADLDQLPPNTPRKVRRAYESATKLTEREKGMASDIQRYFEQRLQDAQQAGVLDKFLEDYYTHVWKDPKTMPKELVGSLTSGRVVTYFENARKRKLSTFLDGIKAGLEPVLDPAKVLPKYNFNLDRSIASRAFIKELTKTTEEDGRPTASPTGSAVPLNNAVGERDATLIKPRSKSDATGDYKTVDNPALRKWKWVDQDSEGKPILVEGELAIHPDALERVKNIMDRNRLTASAATRALIRSGAEVKGAKLGILSPFHQIHVASHALWHLVNPLSVKEIDWTLPSTKFAVESGLKLAADLNQKALFTEGIGPGLIAQKIVPYSKMYSDYLFESYIPRLKLKTFETVYQRDVKRYPVKLTPEQIAQRSADAVNSAYGELNRLWLGKNGRDPRLQRFAQVSLLAPDFLEARARFIGKAFTKYGSEERMALFVMGSTLYVTARVLNQLLDGDPHKDELGMMFSVRYHGKNYSIRSVIGDTAHLLSDWRSFVSTRINPLTTRTAAEVISGRDLRTGVKRDTMGQVEDLLRQIVPSQLDSILPGDRAWWQGLMQSLGVTARHQPTPEQIAKKKKQEEKDKNNPPAAEIIYNPAHKKKTK